MYYNPVSNTLSSTFNLKNIVKKFHRKIAMSFRRYFTGLD